MRALLLFLFFLDTVSSGLPVRKANCRLVASRTYRDGHQKTTYKDVFTYSKTICDKLSLPGKFKENVRTDLIDVTGDNEFNCQVSIWREVDGGKLELLDYFVHADSQKDCKKRGIERELLK